MKKAIYTCITGDYERLKEPSFLTPGWDYICFTNKKLKSQFWEIRKIKGNYSNTRLARRCKILSHEYLPDYKQTIWVDGSFHIRCNLNLITKGLTTAFLKHPERSCAFREKIACIKLKKDKANIIRDQMKGYHDEDMPRGLGLIMSGVMIRTRNPDVEKFMELWWHEVETKSYRDQLSFNYIMWKYPELIEPKYFSITNRQFKKFKHRR